MSRISRTMRLEYWLGLERRGNALGWPWFAQYARDQWWDHLLEGPFATSDGPDAFGYVTRWEDVPGDPVGRRIEGELAYDIRITSPDLGSFHIVVDQELDPFLRQITGTMQARLGEITPAMMRDTTGYGVLATLAIRPRRRRRIGGPWPTSYSSAGRYHGGSR